MIIKLLLCCISLICSFSQASAASNVSTKTQNILFYPLIQLIGPINTIETDLCESIKSNDYDRAEELLNLVSTVNFLYEGKSVLHLHAENHDSENPQHVLFLAKLIERKAIPHFVTKEGIGAFDLLLVKEPRFIKLLNFNKFNLIQTYDNNKNILHFVVTLHSKYAQKIGVPQIILNNILNNIHHLVQQLKEKINHQDGEGLTALHIAAKYKNKRLFNYLKQQGASPVILNSRGQTAHDLLLKPKKGVTIDPFCYKIPKRRNSYDGSLTN